MLQNSELGGAAERRPVSVSELNNSVKLLLESQPSFSGIVVEGEISSVSFKGGHMYFALSDSASKVNCIMWRSRLYSISFKPEIGKKVILTGSINVYPANGTYSLICDSLKEKNESGDLYEAFEKLKLKLASEGLFDNSRKKPIPGFPERVGIITSSSGAAVHDILKNAKETGSLSEVILYDASVQGVNAPAELSSGIRYFNNTDSVDVIIIGRGGGSIEDLNAFNDENLARSIGASHIPVISCVGHEQDFTICDFVADLRCLTPTAAGQVVFPDLDVIRDYISDLYEKELHSIKSLVDTWKAKLARESESRYLKDPESNINDKRQSLAIMSERLDVAENNISRLKKAELKNFAENLNMLNPLSVISRGFSAVYDDCGRLVRSTEDVGKGDLINIKVTDGNIKGIVTEVSKTGKAAENG